MTLRPLDWTDPAYVTAKIARAHAYSEFCRVAGANPYRYGQDGFDHYYQCFTVPARNIFLNAHIKFRAETQRVLASMEGTGDAVHTA